MSQNILDEKQSQKDAFENASHFTTEESGLEHIS